MKILGQATYQSNQQQCEIYAGLHYKIIYAEMGFKQNLQKYIVRVERSAEPIIWKYNRKDPSELQNFEMAVTFQFVKLEVSDLQGDTTVVQTSWWHISDDLFYPFSSKSSGTVLSALTGSVLALLSSVVLF